MSKQEKVSPFVRAISGVIGILDFAAIAYTGSQDGDRPLNVMPLVSFFAGFIFLYVSFFGRYPWDVSKLGDADE